jgi:hypothetical protein
MLMLATLSLPNLAIIILNGAAGNDTYIFASGFGSDRINAFANGANKIDSHYNQFRRFNSGSKCCKYADLILPTLCSSNFLRSLAVNMVSYS